MNLFKTIVKVKKFNKSQKQFEIIIQTQKEKKYNIH
jgi:hypothetical protein